ncbi:MAG: hypothetical protein GTN93_34585, partial [Anaerolineae bacterium]|nr:hypothetical protein [Anaerolineae bacterium]
TELRVFSTVRGQICFTLVVFFPTRKKPIEVPVQHEGSFFIQFLPIVPRPASETPEKCDHCQFWKEGEVYWVCTHEEAWTGDHICKGYPTRTNCPLKGAEFDAAFRQP